MSSFKTNMDTNKKYYDPMLEEGLHKFYITDFECRYTKNGDPMIFTEYTTEKVDNFGEKRTYSIYDYIVLTNTYASTKTKLQKLYILLGSPFGEQAEVDWEEIENKQMYKNKVAYAEVMHTTRSDNGEKQCRIKHLLTAEDVQKRAAGERVAKGKAIRANKPSKQDIEKSLELFGETLKQEKKQKTQAAETIDDTDLPFDL